VLALRNIGEKELHDDRTLASGEFVDQILQEVEEQQLQQMKLRGRGRSIEDIVQEELRREGIDF
jgi:hypothetical protein